MAPARSGARFEFELMARFTIYDLAATIDARAATGGEASYTKKLLDKGAEHCAKKLGEEAVETVIAAIPVSTASSPNFLAQCSAPLSSSFLV